MQLLTCLHLEQDARETQDMLSARNLALLLGQLCLSGCLGASVLFSLLQDLCTRCALTAMVMHASSLLLSAGSVQQECMTFAVHQALELDCFSASQAEIRSYACAASASRMSC